MKTQRVFEDRVDGGETPPLPLFTLRLPPRLERLAGHFRPGSQADRQVTGGRRAAYRHGPPWHRGPVEHAGRPWHAFREILALAQTRRGVLAGVCLLVCVNAAAMATAPVLLHQAVDKLAGGLTNGEAWSGLVRTLVFLALVYLVSALSSFLQGWGAASLSQGTLLALRARIFGHLQQTPIRYFDRMSTGELLSRAANDVELISQMLSRGLVSFVSNVLGISFAIVAMIWMSPTLTLATFIVIPACFLLSAFLSKRLRNGFLAQQTVLGLLNSHLEETVTSLETVKAFNHEAAAMMDFQALNSEMRRVGTLARLLGGFLPPLMNLLSNLGYAMLVGVGAWLVSRGSITVGVIAAFVQFSRQFMRPAMDLANQYSEIQSALAGAERALGLLTLPQLTDASPDAEIASTGDNPNLPGCAIDFDDVTFAYSPGEPILEHFSLHVPAGGKIALVGATGAGKTTVASLLMRLYEPNSGQIRLDGVPLPRLTRARLAEQVAMVLQDTWLFNATVRENLRYGRLDATDEEVEAAANAVGADSFIRRLPQGYDSRLGEDGCTISQGQRQLLAIARAILANPKVLVLDEATSNVDTRTELVVQRAMLHLMQGRTCLVIAHRLSTIREADAILVLEQGRIVEQGTREELLALHGHYWQLEQCLVI